MDAAEWNRTRQGETPMLMRYQTINPKTSRWKQLKKSVAKKYTQVKAKFRGKGQLREHESDFNVPSGSRVGDAVPSALAP